MTAFNNIKTNNWPSASNDLEDFLVLELPLNDQAALTSSRRDIVAGSTLLYPKRTLTNTGASTGAAGTMYSTSGTVTGSVWNATHGIHSAFRPGYLLYGTPAAANSGVFASSGGTFRYTFDGSGLPVTSEIKIYFWRNGGSIKVNAGESNVQTDNSSSGYTVWTIPAGTVSTLKNVELTNSTNTGPYWSGIEIDGVQIADAPGGQKKHYDNNASFTAASQPGSGNRLSVDNLDNFSMGSNESWCFEAYINPTQVTDSTFFGVGNTGFSYRIIAGSPYLYLGGTGAILNTGTISVNTWTHVAVSRDVNTLRSFVNGTQVGSDTTNTTSWDVTSGTGAGVFIGAANLTTVSPPNYHFDGKIQDLRFYKGVAKYTANFTPPGAILD
jgi:hypothetical protein